MLANEWSEDPSEETSDACERALIGCLLQDPRLVNFAPGVTSRSFRQPVLAAAWDAIAELLEEKRYVNYLTVAALTQIPAPDLLALTDVDQCCADEEETREYSRIVIEAAMERRQNERRGEG
jgi:DnaB-like helicase N terminal domain